MKRLVLFLLMLVATPVFTQHIVTGTVVDTAGTRIDGAAVVVMNATDTTSIAWEYSRAGDFRIAYSNPPNMRLLLYIQAHGYHGFYKTLPAEPGEQQLGKLTLSPLHIELGTVAVKAARMMAYDFVRGRDVFQIPKTMGEEAYDLKYLLSQVPGVVVNGENTSLVGRKGELKFTINGMDPRKNELEHLSPRDVEKIYIDRLPSARYGKEVTGVIDIVTRKKLKDHLSMRLSNNFYMKKEPSNSTSVILNNKWGKWSNYLNYSFNYNRNYQEAVYAYTLYLPNEEFRLIYTQAPLHISTDQWVVFSPKYQINDNSFIDLQYRYDFSRPFLAEILKCKVVFRG